MLKAFFLGNMLLFFGSMLLSGDNLGFLFGFIVCLLCITEQFGLVCSRWLYCCAV